MALGPWLVKGSPGTYVPAVTTRADPATQARTTMPAGHAIAVVLVALLLGGLFNAQDVRATAERQPFGWRRTAATTAVAPLVAISDVLRLDRPRAALDAALGRGPAPEPSVVAPQPAATPVVEAVASPTPTVLQRRPVTAADPLRVYLGGDSMMAQFGPALANLLEATGAAQTEVQYEFETGLTRSDFFDWPARLREVVAAQNPEVMVLYFGGNDAQDVSVDGQVLTVSTPEWIAEYRRRVDAVIDEFTADGRFLYWLGMPVVSSDTFQPRVDILNQVYAAAAAEHPQVTYIDPGDLFRGPDGGYSEFLPDDTGAQVDMRLDDGVHYTTAGAQRLAAPVFAQFAQDWQLPQE